MSADSTTSSDRSDLVYLRQILAELTLEGAARVASKWAFDSLGLLQEAPPAGDGMSALREARAALHQPPSAPDSVDDVRQLEARLGALGSRKALEWHVAEVVRSSLRCARIRIERPYGEDVVEAAVQAAHHLRMAGREAYELRRREPVDDAPDDEGRFGLLALERAIRAEQRRERVQEEGESLALEFGDSLTDAEMSECRDFLVDLARACGADVDEESR